ncbi:MAG TPA: AmmeMemoRadiSam system protein B [Candidatus Binataceae bacterium]
MDTPRIRAVEAFPVEHQGQTMICLRDPMAIAPQPILLGMGGYFLITQFDGRHTLAEIREAYARQFGEVLAAGKIEELIEALDQAFYLDSENFARRRAAVRDEFNASSERGAIHAGLCYEGDARRLRDEMAAFFDPPQGPGRSPQRRNNRAPAGLIAPHIDPRRGGPAYAHAYFELMGCEPPELFIILGTSHYGSGPELFSATLKNYATPLGAVQTDRDFVARLARRYSAGDLFADELLHRNEHSIEFQALFLAWALGTLGYQVVPILVSSFHEMVAAGRMPAADSRVRSFIEALRAELAADSRSACIIAGVDFAHVGRKFGDERAADEDFVKWVGQEDHALIENILRGDPEGFFHAIDKDKDRRRICGLSPMYTQLELLRGRSGRLLKYDVALEPPTQSAVSFASLAID